jgi:hypothetical protein
MRKYLLIALLLLAAPLVAHANDNVQGWCEAGATLVVTQGLTSTTQVQGSFPQCTININVHGGGLATIYSDNNNTVLGNPFVAQTNGQWIAYAAQGRYDITMSGGGLLGPVTYTDVVLFDPAQFGGIQCVLASTSFPTFTANTCSLFSMTLTSNVTASNLTGGVAGQAITISLCQNSTGGYMFVWPAAFYNPPNPSTIALSCGQYSFVWLADGLWHSTAVGGQVATPIVDNIIYIDGNVYPATGAGLALAYAACLSNGCHIIAGSDIVVSSPQTLQLTAGKPLFLDFAGRNMYCSNSSGACLEILKPDTAPRDPFEMANGIVSYTGSAAGVIGIQIAGNSGFTGGVSNGYIHGMAINNFSTSASVGLDLNWVDDFHLDSMSYQGNTLALRLDLNTNQVQFSNNWFQSNVNAILGVDASGITFEDSLIQSNTGTTPVVISAVTTNIEAWKFKHSFFENNGDTTSATRQISFQPSTGKFILHTELDNNILNGGANVSSGSYVFGESGGGTALGLSLRHNTYFTATNFFSGANFIPGIGISSDNDPVTNADVALAPWLFPGCQPYTGIGFNSLTAGKVFQIFGGYSGELNNALNFYDCTDSVNMLSLTPTAFVAPVALQSKRYYGNKGTALMNGDGTLTGWGSGASLYLNGYDSEFNFEIATSSVNAPSTNPTMTLTFADGAWSDAFPICVVGNAGSAVAEVWSIQAFSTTSITIEYFGTPSISNLYEGNVICQGQ